jgi:hypothetical protein
MAILGCVGSVGSGGFFTSILVFSISVKAKGYRSDTYYRIENSSRIDLTRLRKKSCLIEQ